MCSCIFRRGTPYSSQSGAGVVLQVVIEELLHALGVVLLIRRPREAVVLTRVLEQHDRLAEPAQRVEVLHALREVHGAVLIVVQDDERRLSPWPRDTTGELRV